MLSADRDRALALSYLIQEDVAIAMNVPVTDLPEAMRNFAEAVGMFVFATGALEKTAATGALVYCAAQLP